MDWLTGKHKAKKNAEQQSQPWAELPMASNKIFKCHWRDVCQTPPGVPTAEWVAANTRPFFNNLSLIYASFGDHCTVTSCPTMAAGPKVEYHWVDEKGKRTKGLAAPQYIDYVFSYVQATLDNDHIFPTRLDMAFPADFMAISRKLYRLLLQVTAHLYAQHFAVLQQLGLVPHLNTVFTHFLFFATEHILVEAKDLGPLSGLAKLLLESK